MKKLAILIICTVLLCSCQASSKQSRELNIELYEAVPEELDYLIDDPFVFSANEAGEVVCADRNNETVKRYSEFGELIDEFQIPDGFSVISLACDTSSIFLLGSDLEQRLVLLKAESGGTSELYSMDSYTQNSRICLEVSGDKIYFSAVGTEPKTFNYPDGAYRYNGLMLYEFDRESGKCEEICGAVSFTKNRDGGVMLYCCDDEGFYFTSYNGGFGEKYYSKLGDLYTFSLIGENAVAYPSDGYIKASLLSGEVSVDMFEARYYGSRPVISSSGTLIYNSVDIFGEKISIRRIQPMNYIKSLQPINIIMTGNFAETFVEGYAVNKQFISEEEIVLKLLAKDTDWDAAAVYSRQPFAEQIASQGVFLPLEEEEYIESCRSQIRDVCTTEDGTIWALPLGVNISCIVYNKEKCNEYGIDFSEMTTEDFLEKTRELCEDESLKGTWVAVSWWYLNETLLNDCIYNCDPDSDRFRSIAESLKENANILTDAEYMQPKAERILEDGSVISVPNNSFLDNPDEFLYSTTLGYTDAMSHLKLHPDFSVAKIPFDGVNTGYCMLMVVNPYSPNTEITLELVSDLAEEQLAEIKEYSELTTEGKRQLDEVYDNSKIIMGIPDEIYRNDFWAYLGDEITLDEFVSRVKDKMSMYLNE